MMVNCFNKLYASTGTVVLGHTMQACVTPEDNEHLFKTFTIKEILKTLFLMHLIRRQALMVCVPLFSNF